MPGEDYFFETQATIRYAHPARFKSQPLAMEILDKLAEQGHVFGRKAYIGLYSIELRSVSHILTVCIDEAHPCEIIVAVETPEGPKKSDQLAAERFRICVAATRFVLDTLPADQVRWMHRYNYFVTKNGTIVDQGSLAPPDPAMRPAANWKERFGHLGPGFLNAMFDKAMALVECGPDRKSRMTSCSTVGRQATAWRSWMPRLGRSGQ